MKFKTTDLNNVGAFSEMFLNYIKGTADLKPFYNHKPDLAGLEEAFKKRQFDQEKRVVLYEVLMEQYGPLPKKDASFNNILSLQSDKTFTVTTGHQLNIFTGPLYVIFKIVTTISLCRKLKETYPDYHFVPVYWMASEDHDFEEIASFNLFGKKYTWETEQGGPVGRFAPQSLNMLLEQLPEPVPVFEQAYLDQSTLAESVRYYMHELFGDEGLVVIDADHQQLKEVFAPYIKEDITKNFSNQKVEETNARLEQAGYKSQVFSRKINFFYLNGVRERITAEDGLFKVNNTQLAFTEEELLNDIDSHPDRFSPNVIMRPLYQEVILPNIGYIGGPSELVYWLQLKGVFEHYQVGFPVLLPRNFGMIINKGLNKKLNKLWLPDELIYKEAHEIKAWYLAHHQDNEHLLDEEKESLNKVFEQIKTKACSIDQTLEGFIGAEGNKALKSLENIQKRFKKSLENQNEVAMNQIDTLKEKLFPNGGLQERHDNFLNFALNKPDFISTLLSSFDPLEHRFYQFWEE